MFSGFFRPPPPQKKKVFAVFLLKIKVQILQIFSEIFYIYWIILRRRNKLSFGPVQFTEYSIPLVYWDKYNHVKYTILYCNTKVYKIQIYVNTFYSLFTIAENRVISYFLFVYCNKKYVF